MIADQEERPWETPGEIRRDAAPHRGLPLCCAAIGSFILALGGALLSLLMMLHFILVPGFLVIYGCAIALGTWTWLAARKDLAKIHWNEMVIDGENSTMFARDLAKAALVVCLLVPLFWLGVLLISWL
jgi:hypothetical protein